MSAQTTITVKLAPAEYQLLKDAIDVAEEALATQRGKGETSEANRQEMGKESVMRALRHHEEMGSVQDIIYIPARGAGSKQKVQLRINSQRPEIVTLTLREAWVLTLGLGAGLLTGQAAHAKSAAGWAEHPKAMAKWLNPPPATE